MMGTKAAPSKTNGGRGRGDDGQPLPLGVRVAVVVLLLAVVLFVVGRVTRAGAGSTAVAVGVAVAGAALLAWSLVQARRRQQVQVIADTVEGVLGRPVVRTSGVRWRWRRLTRVVVEYPAHVSDSDPRMRERAATQLSARMGGQVDLDWDTVKRTVTITRRAHVAPEDRRDPLPQVARIETVIELIFGSNARVKALDWEEELLVRFLVSYPPTSQDAADQWRMQSDAVLMEKTGQWWVSHWEPETDQVTYSMRTALPTQVDHTDIGDLPTPPPPAPPSSPTPPPGGGSGWVVPVGAAPAPAAPVWPSSPPVLPPGSEASVPVPGPTVPEMASVPAAHVAVDVASMPFAKARSEILEWSPVGGSPHCLVIGSTGSGKSLGVHEMIPGPSGGKLMGSLEVGDKVFDDQGRPCSVTGVYDQPDGRPSFEVEFSDGSVIVADGEHLWTVEDRAARISRQHQRRLPRKRRPLVDPERLDAARAALAAADRTDEMTVPDAARLLGVTTTHPILYQVVHALAPSSERQLTMTFRYSAQEVTQRQRVLVCDRAELVDRLAAHLAGSRSAERRCLASVVEGLARGPQTIMAVEAARALGWTRSQIGHTIERLGLAASVEARPVTLHVPEKTVVRQGTSVRLYPTQALLAALIEAFDHCVRDQRDRRLCPQTITTAQIAATLRTTSGHVNWSVPVVAGPLQCPHADLPLDPYLLGAWLGDGATNGHGRWCSEDPEILAAFGLAGFDVRDKGPCDNHGSYYVMRLKAALRPLGVVGDKHIPEAYLWADEGQRLSLLQGLMDTDGSANSQGTCEFYASDERLARQVRQLVASLGMAAQLRSKPGSYRNEAGEVVSCKTAWTVTFAPTAKVFRLQRKLERLDLDARRDSTRYRYIVDVRPVPSVPMRCISVDSPSLLYLAGESMIPTHNTATIRTFVVAAALRGYHVFICDPKRTELFGFAVTEWPNVHEVATELDEMVLLVERLYQEMEERYRRIREQPALKRSLPPMLVVIDEAREWIDRIQASWKQAGGKGEHPTIERFRSLARLARTARIFLLVGIQRPDAAVFGGEARDNFRTRVACGELSPEGARMLGLTASGRVSENVPGRVMADVGDGWIEAQVIWTPDPSDDLSPAERDIIRRLRPAESLAPLVLPPAELPEPEQPASKARKPKTEPPGPPPSVAEVGGGVGGPVGGMRRFDQAGQEPAGGLRSGFGAPVGSVSPPVLRVLQGGGQNGRSDETAGERVEEGRAVVGPGGPAGWYVAGLRAVLESGLAHLASRDETCPEGDPGIFGWSEDGRGGWTPNGDRVGWVDPSRGELLLLPDASMDTVGTHDEVTAGDLGKLLAEAGVLVRLGEGSHVGAKIRIGGGRPRVWVMDASVLSGVPAPPTVADEPAEDLGPGQGAISEAGPTPPEPAPAAQDVAPPPVRHQNRFLDPMPPGVTRRRG